MTRDQRIPWESQGVCDTTGSLSRWSLGYYHKALTFPLHRVLEQLDCVLSGAGVQISCRHIRQNNIRVVGQGPGCSGSLLLSPAQFRWGCLARFAIPTRTTLDRFPVTAKAVKKRGGLPQKHLTRVWFDTSLWVAGAIEPPRGLT